MTHKMRSPRKIPKVVDLDVGIWIIKGKDLVAKDRLMLIGPTNSSDPYIKAYYGDERNEVDERKPRYETKVIDKTLNPVWNEQFRMRVRGDDMDSALKGKKDYNQLILHIYDKDKLSKDDFMGECVVPLPLTDLHIDSSTVKWYRVNGRSEWGGKPKCINATGKIEVQITVSETKGTNMTVGTIYEMPKRIQVALRWNIKDPLLNENTREEAPFHPFVKIKETKKRNLKSLKQSIRKPIPIPVQNPSTPTGQTTVDNSCVAVDNYGNILMNESAYFGHLTNSNESIRCSGDMYEGETVFTCDLNSPPDWVRALYFIVTVATPDKTLNDLNNFEVKVFDKARSKSMYQWAPNISVDDTAMFLMRISRENYSWSVSLIEDGDHIARDFGTLIPEIKGYSRDINPEIKLNPKEGIAIMRPDRSIRIRDYANNAGLDQNLGLGFKWKSTGRKKKYIDFHVSAICLDAHLSEVEVISLENPGADNGSIRHGGDMCNLDEDKDNEEVFINLDTVDSDIMYVGFVISERYGKELDHVERAKCHLFNSDTKLDLALYQISDDVWSKKYTGLLVLCLCRGSGDWTLRSIEEPTVFEKDADSLTNFFRNAPVLEPTAVPDREIILNQMPDVNLCRSSRPLFARSY